ncbi:MAG: hypothetical protein JWO70_3691 [Betaproteobacteria bacterium]|nr:hypothetical protein [Betaproteobacteria bacterium]
MRSTALGVLLACLIAASGASAQTALRCAVADPELQGSYTGGCEGGYASGTGEARGSAYYKGEFRAGRKYGKGVKSWPATGDRYEGDFVDDRKQGSGMYAWGRGSASAGERYAGGYLADRRHGYGVYEWPNGERYAGPWADDAITGVPTRGMIARARAQAERAAAVGVSGAKVCRELRVGVATEDLIRGTVVSRQSDTIRVRIDDAGKFEHVLRDRPVRKGEVFSEPLRVWFPCT